MWASIETTCSIFWLIIWIVVWRRCKVEIISFCFCNWDFPFNRTLCKADSKSKGSCWDKPRTCDRSWKGVSVQKRYKWGSDLVFEVLRIKEMIICSLSYKTTHLNQYFPRNCLQISNTKSYSNQVYHKVNHIQMLADLEERPSPPISYNSPISR